MLQAKKYRFCLICLSALFLFTTCKKYPENNLWFKNPAKVLARGEGHPWILDYYSVNDLDSTASDFLKVYKEQGIVMIIKPGKSGDYIYNSFDVLHGYWELANKKKNIDFRFTMYSFFSNSPSNSNYLNQRNIFLESAFEWKINKLTKAQFWISTNYNSIKYEIHFK